MLGNQDKSDLVKSQVSKAPRNRSSFDLSHHHLTTLPFGYVLPFFKMETVAGDKITLRSDMSLNTFTLKSPIISNIRMKKDYINVPMEAILPFNWDKIFTNPVIGDDVPSDCICAFNPYLRGPLGLSFDSSLNKDVNLFGVLSIIELVFSKGSLMSRLGYNLSKYVTITDNNDSIVYSVDDFVEHYYNLIFDYYHSNGYCNFRFIDHLDTANQPVYVNASLPLKTRSDLRKLHRYFNEHAVTNLSNLEPNKLSLDFTIKFDNLRDDQNINISSVAAYQITYAHYYSNDRVDYIYSAELYRQMMKHYCTFVRNSGNAQFELNGTYSPYDYLSAYYINSAYSNIVTTAITGQFYGSINYLQNLFGFRRSLRYLDYFTGSKVRPLGVGDVSVQVGSSSVSAVDVTRSIQMQRFLNFVNRTGRKFEEYVGKLTGVFVKPDFHNPQYLAHTVDNLYNSRVENTSDAQMTRPNSITSTFVGDSRNFAFEFESDRPSIILGLVSFDIVRSYSDSIDRDAFHLDRYDYFNPFLQHIGDQPIYGCEFDTSHPLTISEYFGYQTRHSEYKQIYNRADSGFCDGSLPSWAYINDVSNQSARGTDVLTISPENIRSFPEELDDFYLSLDGISLSKYFHFIVDFYNIVEAKRPMISSPNIL